MCGLTGYLSSEHADATAMTARVRHMAAQLRHRGPDDRGEWVDPERGVALGHRRLAIIDVSPQGHQPMISSSGRFVAAYNGEIYNYRELRAELEAAGAATAWRGHSDTEVMLAAFEHFGLETALKRFNGMFALALWDRRDCRLHLARDRFGEKPLYYGSSGEVFYFASELKALAAHPVWNGEIDRGALALYMRFNYVPAPHTIYTGVQKLPPGALLTLSMDSASRRWQAGPVQHYWSAVDVALEARTRPLTNFAEAKRELKSRLSQAVRARTISDVPLGAFLSGGIDSSLVVALMRTGSTERVRTFTIGFDDPRYDESEHAQRVAEHLGTEHVCHRVTPVEAQRVILDIPALYDEPFADTSQIPTYLVALAARQQVTVALTGDGGDELFGGYERYFVGPRAMRWSRRCPAGVRRLMAASLAAMTPAAWDTALRALRRTLGRGRLSAVTGQRLHRLAHLLRADGSLAMYETLMCRHDETWVVGAGVTARASPFEDPSSWLARVSDAEAMMLFDVLNVLPDDFLVKVDRAAMGASLETRAPLLDPEVFELVWRMPVEWKIEASRGKILARDLLSDFVPSSLVERPKQGFGIPISPWLRGPLREWAEDLLDPARLRREGFLEPEPIRERWKRHVEGTHDCLSEVWSALVFQQWYADQRRPQSSRTLRAA